MKSGDFEVPSVRQLLPLAVLCRLGIYRIFLQRHAVRATKVALINRCVVCAEGPLSSGLLRTL